MATKIKNQPDLVGIKYVCAQCKQLAPLGTSLFFYNGFWDKPTAQLPLCNHCAEGLGV